MPATITLFANLTNPTGPELDDNFRVYTSLTVIPCSVAGTNTLTLTQLSNTPTFTAYQNYMQFSGVVSASNSGAVTARIGSLGFLNVYRDSAAGPTLLVGGELVANCAFTLLYDSTLNSGSGGWHLFTGPTLVPSTLNVTNLTVGTLTATIATVTALTAATGIVTTLRIGSSLATLTRANSALGTLTFTVTPANTVQDQPLVMSGAQVLDVISLGLGASAPASCGFTGFCGTLGTVTVRLLNPTGASISLTTVTVHALAMGVTP